MSEDSTRPVMSWQEIRAHAQTRPAMYIGSQETGHKSTIRDALRLVWQARVFRQPQTVTVDLSPTQYVVRAECGPLIRSVQQIFTFGDGKTLSGPWQEQGKAYFSRVVQENEQRSLGFSQRQDRRGWRYCFSGPTGPRLASPTYPFILARSGAWVYARTMVCGANLIRKAYPSASLFC